MPRGKATRQDGFYEKSRSAERAKNGWQESQFVQRELSLEEKIACKDWDLSLESAVAMLEQLIEQGYKVTFRWDDRGRCAACWVIAPEGHPLNAGKILPGRGSEAWKAFKQCCFKAQHIFGGEAWPITTPQGPEDIDD